MLSRGYNKLRAASWWMMVVWFLFYTVVSSNIRHHSLDKEFMEAAEHHDFDRQRDLLHRGANIDARDENDNRNTALIKVVAYEIHPTFRTQVDQGTTLAEIEFLLERGADSTLRTADGQTALAIAATNQERQAIKLLKEYGASR